MKNLVVCIKVGKWTTKRKGSHPPGPDPIKGHIYEVIAVIEDDGEDYYDLRGFPLDYFNSRNFRPVDNTFGEVVAEIIEKQLELETVNA